MMIGIRTLMNLMFQNQKAKKPVGKKAAKEEDDFKIDEDFKDLGLFNDDAGGGFDDDEDDF